jgi:CO dehydrogenase nickel-insertion accessory protein CooC1
MTRFGFAVLATLSAASVARAEEAKIIVVDADDHARYAKIVAAAEQVCKAALSRDYFDDFGSLQECMQNTRQAAHRVPASDSRRISSAK